MKIIKKNKKHNFKKDVMEGYFMFTLSKATFYIKVGNIHDGTEPIIFDNHS